MGRFRGCMKYAGESRSVTAKAPRLVEQVRGRLRLKHYSLRTEQAYVGRIRRFIPPAASGIRGRWRWSRSRRSSAGWQCEEKWQRASRTRRRRRCCFCIGVLSIELPWMESEVRAKRSCAPTKGWITRGFPGHGDGSVRRCARRHRRPAECIHPVESHRPAIRRSPCRHRSVAARCGTGCRGSGSPC